jgi:hypothetical protein
MAAYVLVMTDAAKKHDARYAGFAARMLACLAAEEADIARRNAVAPLYQGAADTASATVRPAKCA